MQKRLGVADKEWIKQRLKKYAEKGITCNEPHFTNKLDLQNIDKNEVIHHILNPEKLAFVGASESKNRKYRLVYDLYFQTGKNRTLKIPASLKSQSLYLISVIKIKRKVQHEARKYYGQKEL